jgi:hypothetical protein
VTAAEKNAENAVELLKAAFGGGRNPSVRFCRSGKKDTHKTSAGFLPPALLYCISQPVRLEPPKKGSKKGGYSENSSCILSFIPVK